MQSSTNVQIILLMVLCFAMQMKQQIYYIFKKNVRSVSYNEHVTTN